MTTITLSNISGLTASVSVPRIAAIEYPFGRIFGNPGDKDGQKAILLATLKAIVELEFPGTIRHLPFEWQELAKKASTHPPKPAPIVTYLIRHPWLVPRLLSRNVPK